MNIHERRAKFVYEAARVEAEASNRRIVPEPWMDREAPFREQFVKTIERICADGYETTPEREHDSWWRAYEAMGWKYGPVRDRERKEHPDMVPYNDLTIDERDKDEIFLELCKFARKYICDGRTK
jgi:hypothetical protein